MAILDLVQLEEVGPFNPPSPKPFPRIKHKVDWTTHSRDRYTVLPANLMSVMWESLLYATRCKAGAVSI